MSWKQKPYQVIACAWTFSSCTRENQASTGKKKDELTAGPKATMSSWIVKLQVKNLEGSVFLFIVKFAVEINSTFWLLCRICIFLWTGIILNFLFVSLMIFFEMFLKRWRCDLKKSSLPFKFIKLYFWTVQMSRNLKTTSNFCLKLYD